MLALEAGKPMRHALAEVKRAVNTLRLSAIEAQRLYGEVIPMDLTSGGAGKSATVSRFPLGPILGITPFNFPLNLVAHKIAPAIAAGCPLVLKPAPATPLTALRLQALLQEAGLPDGAFQIVTGGADVGRWLIEDPRIAMITFTGSPAVAAVAHPLERPADRDAGFENGRPVTIGRNVWIGGGALILPGVTVGDDAIIGAMVESPANGNIFTDPMLADPLNRVKTDITPMPGSPAANAANAGALDYIGGVDPNAPWIYEGWTSFSDN